MTSGLRKSSASVKWVGVVKIQLSLRITEVSPEKVRVMIYQVKLDLNICEMMRMNKAVWTLLGERVVD